VNAAGGSDGFPLFSVEVRYLGGELCRSRPCNGALASIEARYAFFAVGVTPAPQAQAPAQVRIQSIQAALAPWAARHLHLNIDHTQRDPAKVLGRAGLSPAAADQGASRPR